MDSVPGRSAILAVLVAAGCGFGLPGSPPEREAVVIRGHEQSVYMYGPTQGDPVIVSSGDGGWIHLAPHVAEVLAAHGLLVVGFDARAYLSSFTSRESTLRPDEEPADYRVLAQFASKATGRKPILVGVSEGAGLSVLAATDRDTKPAVKGVIALGLPNMNELAWRWKDMSIYVTHRVPNEPGFRTEDIVNRVAPIPLAAIHSTHDEFVAVADASRLLDRAGDPKRLWIVPASDHRFSDNLKELDRQLLEAIAWVNEHSPR
jgi:alpha-beta hydrolase superfamily lysophospholipase